MFENVLLSSTTWVFPKIVVPPNHPLKNRVFHYKPSIFGYLYFWKHPHPPQFGHFLVLQYGSVVGIAGFCWKTLIVAFQPKVKALRLSRHGQGDIKKCRGSGFDIDMYL